MIASGIGALSLAIWLYLLAFRDGFWRARERDDGACPAPAAWPAVIAIVPARDEAEVIGRTIAGLAAQDYPGAFRIVLVDDGSSDGTAGIARAAAGPDKLTVLTGTPLPPGWTGKLWAMAQGVAAAGDADTGLSSGEGLAAAYLWFTDADILHASDTLRMLVARAVAERLVLHTLMAELRCETLAERALVPAFVFFFQMLYPFAAVNDPRRPEAGAAGGCMLVEAAALERAGGVARIRSALIDDCAMGVALKKQGPVRLSLTRRSLSIRPYGDWADIGRMIARSAYAQLGYAPWKLGATLAGMGIVYLAPPLLAVFGHGWARGFGLAAWALMALAFVPMLRFYRRSTLWGVALPAIAAFYTGATFASALAHWRGRGGMWKGRAQAQPPARTAP